MWLHYGGIYHPDTQHLLTWRTYDGIFHRADTSAFLPSSRVVVSLPCRGKLWFVALSCPVAVSSLFLSLSRCLLSKRCFSCRASFGLALLSIKFVRFAFPIEVSVSFLVVVRSTTVRLAASVVSRSQVQVFGHHLLQDNRGLGHDHRWGLPSRPGICPGVDLY